MIRIMYYSAAIGRPSTEALEAILAKARVNNQRDKISGLLMYHDGAFLQILEGEEAKVAALYEKIHADTRHCDVMKVFETQVGQRLFNDWGMGFARPQDFRSAHAPYVIALDRIIAALPTIGNRDRRAETMMRSFLATFEDYEGKVA